MTNSNIILYNNDLWVSQDYLKDAGLSADYLRVAKTRGKKNGKSWTHETIANRDFFKYSSLPSSTTAKLEEPGTLHLKAVEVRNYIVDIVANALYRGFKAFLKGMNEDEAKAAAVVHEAFVYIQNNGISYSKSQFFDELGKEIDIQGLKYLPTSWRNLRDKIKAYADGTPINELVYAKNKGNDNRSLFTNNDMMLNWLFDLGHSQRNYTASFIYRKLRTTCLQHGIDKIPSQRWVSDFMAKPETQFLIQQRYGDRSRFNNKYRSYTPTAGALYAGDCWDIDGTRVNIIDHRATVLNKEGKRVTSQKFLYIIAVRDVMSGLPLGWEYCYEESADAVMNALAMAVRNTGYLPYEIRYDRFPGHNTQDWMWLENTLRRNGVTMTQTVRPEAKGRIERWWGSLQTVFMAESDLYYGEGVKSSRKYAHRAKEYVIKMRQWAVKNGFDFDDAIRETDKILDNYIRTPYCDWSTKYRLIDKSPMQLHYDCTKPNTKPINGHQWAYLFGLRKEVSIRNYMIQTQIDNATYYYGIDDCDIAEKYTGVKLWNCFDIEDLDKVHLYDGEKYLGTFSRITPAQQYGPNKDMRAVGKMKAIGEKMNKHIASRLAEIAKTEEPETISQETGILLTGRVAKKEYEASETAFLHSEWDDEGENIKVNIRNQY